MTEHPPSPDRSLIHAPSPVIWGEDGVPRSRLFDDIYYSAADGLAESRAVFLAGCGLPDVWRDRSSFVVGELGFGSGLNILALLALWRDTRAPCARLHVFSVEAFPMPAEDARRALSAWPEIGDLAETLLRQWPRRARGFHRIVFENLNAIIDLAVMEVGDALAAWTGAADAWFLDGFSPAANPAMWSPDVLAEVAAHSAPGARAATFTVAGAVRRGLADAGFEVAKRPGFGRKSERLEALWPGFAAAPSGRRASTRVAILGAGIAGASLARAFKALGAAPVVIDAEAPGAGASGNAAALVMARLDAGGEDVAQLYAQALARAHDLFSAIPGAVIARGALQLESGSKDPSRFDRIADDPLFEPGAMLRLSPREAEARLGEATEAGGLLIGDALTVEPATVLAAWLAGIETLRGSVERIERGSDGWRLVGPDAVEIMQADIVCIAAGAGAARVAPDLPLSSVRGQVSAAPTTERVSAALWGGYVVPTRAGVMFGATHDRNDADVEERDEDHLRNLEALAEGRPNLAAKTDPRALEGRARSRAVTPDFLPLAGAVSGPEGSDPPTPGLYILSGLGSRGFCAAPLLAEHVAALALGCPSPLPRAVADIVDPGRFERRRKRRLRSRPAGDFDTPSPDLAGAGHAEGPPSE